MRGNPDEDKRLTEALSEDPFQVHMNARDVSQVLDRTARVLDESARLAAAHADRQERAGRIDLALEERRAAARAAEAAERARVLASRFGELATEGAARTRDRHSVYQPD